MSYHTTNLHGLEWVLNGNLSQGLVELQLCGTCDGVCEGKVLSQDSCL